MTIQELRSAYEAAPFRPFTMHLADGRNIPVQHREFMMTVPDGRTIVIAQPDGTLNIIDLLLVTDLELKPLVNGSRKPRRRKPA